MLYILCTLIALGVTVAINPTVLVHILSFWAESNFLPIDIKALHYPAPESLPT